MKALIELCDLIAQNPKQFSDRLAWICNRCSQLDLLLSGSPCVSRSHLNAVLAVARFLSKCSEEPLPRAKSLVLDFFRAIPSSFHRSFWPQAFSNSILSFFTDFLGYVLQSTDVFPDFEADIAAVSGEVVLAAVNYNMAEDLGVLRVFSPGFVEKLPANSSFTCEYGGDVSL